MKKSCQEKKKKKTIYCALDVRFVLCSQVQIMVRPMAETPAGGGADVTVTAVSGSNAGFGREGARSSRIASRSSSRSQLALPSIESDRRLSLPGRKTYPHHTRVNFSE